MSKLRIFVALILAACIALAAYLWPQTPLDLGWRTYIGLFVFLIINIAADSHPLQLAPGKVQLTISGLSSYALLALFPPAFAGLIGGLSVLIVQTFFSRKSITKRLFNTGQVFLSLSLAALFYQVVYNANVGAPIPAFITASCFAIVAYFLINTGLVSAALAIVNTSSFCRNWSGNFRWELVYMAGSVPIAILLILAYQRLWIAGPLLFIAPLFLLRDSYAQYVRLKATYRETVRTLVKIIETHDTYTAGHSLRVAEYATRLATAIRLRPIEIEKIEIAAYLHDLGKVDLAITHLVTKPGKLTPDEKRRIQLHPIVSADLAAQVSYFKGDIEAIIRHHHEHYNGTGYPHGLVGEDIPLGARIILIADAFDAMTSTRMYRGALDFARVQGEFRKFAGIQFDLELVETFLTQCVKDESMIIPQVEIAYEELLSTKLTQEEEEQELQSVGQGADSIVSRMM